MEKSLLFGFLIACLVLTSCLPVRTTGAYYYRPSSQDSIRIEFYLIDDEDPFVETFSAPATPDRDLLFHEIFDEELDDPATIRPQVTFDSLFIYHFVNGRDSLFYSGVRDADWTEEEWKRKRYKFRLRF